MMGLCCEKEKIDETLICVNIDVCLQGKNETKPSERKWPMKIDTILFVIMKRKREE